jgi:hypothetical protein
MQVGSYRLTSDWDGKGKIHTELCYRCLLETSCTSKLKEMGGQH